MSLTPIDSETGLIDLIGALICVMFAALASGLTLGLASFNELDLEIIMRTGDENEKKWAKKLSPLIKRHHLLLVTLLVFNSVANESLPLFLDELVPSYLAIIFSVTLVLIFGEIIPGALFLNPATGLKFSANLAPLVWCLIGFFWIVSYPISKFLDFWLGHDKLKRYNRAELSALVNVQNEDCKDDKDGYMVLEDNKVRNPLKRTHLIAGGLGSIQSYTPRYKYDEKLTKDEVGLVQGVLGLSEKRVVDIMLPLESVYSLDIQTKLDMNTMADILKRGFSRVPIYRNHYTNIQGFLLIQRLIPISPSENRLISSLHLRKPLVVSPKLSLIELLNQFQEGRSHIAIVSSNPNKTRAYIKKHKDHETNGIPIGLITLEDVIEELLQEEIYDERDRAIQERAMKVFRKRILKRRIKKKIHPKYKRKTIDKITRQNSGYLTDDDDEEDLVLIPHIYKDNDQSAPMPATDSPYSPLMNKKDKYERYDNYKNDDEKKQDLV